jgi:hypothetical protein
MVMSTASRAAQPWDSLDYQRIVSARYRGGEVVVVFADGSEARLSPDCLVPSGGPELDFPGLRAEDFHLVVSSPAGEIEIPWDVIRVHSDPAYDAFWAEIAAKPVGSGAATRAEPGG